MYSITMEHKFFLMSMYKAWYSTMLWCFSECIAWKFSLSPITCSSSIIIDLTAYIFPVFIFLHLLTKPFAPSPIVSKISYLSSNKVDYLIYCSDLNLRSSPWWLTFLSGEHFYSLNVFIFSSTLKVFLLIIGILRKVSLML